MLKNHFRFYRHNVKTLNRKEIKYSKTKFIYEKKLRVYLNYIKDFRTNYKEELFN